MVHRTDSNRSIPGEIFGAFIGAAVFALAVSAISMPADAADWKGTEIAKEGVTHVMNPAQPVEAQASVSPKLLWRAGGDDEEYLFGVIAGIAADKNGEIYLLDTQLNDIKIFSPAGEYLRSIGREGEGPGEFRRPSDLFFTVDGNVAVVQRMPGRIILLKPDGTPAGNFLAPEPPDGGMQMFANGRFAGDRIVLATQQMRRRGDSGMDEVSALIAVDATGNKIAEYLSMKNSRDFANMVFDEKEIGINSLIWEAGNDGRVYVCDAFDPYRITAYNKDGSIDRVLEREYEPRIRSEEERKWNTPRVMIRSNNRSMTPEVVSSKTDRAVMQVYPRPDGTLWVLSSRGAFDAPAGTIGTFDVFDRAGRFVKQIAVKGDGSLMKDGIYIIGDRLIVVKGLRSARRAMFNIGTEEGTDEEDVEPVSVLCYDLTAVR